MTGPGCWCGLSALTAGARLRSGSSSCDRRGRATASSSPSRSPRTQVVAEALLQKFEASKLLSMASANPGALRREPHWAPNSRPPNPTSKYVYSYAFSARPLTHPGDARVRRCVRAPARINLSIFLSIYEYLPIIWQGTWPKAATSHAVTCRRSWTDGKTPPFYA